MSDYRFGDVLRYPDEQGVGDSILFMYICPEPGFSGPITVMVLRTTEDDDLWEPGHLVTAGINELRHVTHVARSAVDPLSGSLVTTYRYLNMAGLRDR